MQVPLSRKGREQRLHPLCSCGFVSLPIKVRVFSLIKAKVSRLGALILLIDGSSGSIMSFLFSASEKRRAITALLGTRLASQHRRGNGVRGA